MDGIPRQGDGNGKRGHQYQDIFAEEQLVQVLHAGTVHLADTYFAIALADIEKRDAEQAQARYTDGYQGKNGIDGGYTAVFVVDSLHLVFHPAVTDFVCFINIHHGFLQILNYRLFLTLLDTDVELVKSLDSLLCHNCYFGLQQAGHFISTGVGFGAEKQSMILKKIMDSYNAITFSLEKKEELACPKLNTQIFEKEGYIYSSSIFENEKFTIYPAKYFDPYMTHHGGVNLFCDDTYSIHHYSATWCDSSQILKRKLVRFVGADNIIKIRNFIHNLFSF